jgi:hypothetical protein
MITQRTAFLLMLSIAIVMNWSVSPGASCMRMSPSK